MIKEDTNIFITKTTDSIMQVLFNHEKIKESSDWDKYINYSSNELVFEQVRDFANPTFNYCPFLLY
jgi:hypothetical protein